jgi:hypothetical protein
MLSIPTVSVLLFAASSLVSLAPCRAAPAQQIPVSAGQRVRLEWAEGQRRHRAVGTVLEARGDSLALTEPAGARALALADLERIDVRVPRSRALGAARGAGFGTFVGLAAGLVFGAASYAGCPRGDDDLCPLYLIFPPAIGAGAGLVAGAVIGAADPGQRWRRVR